MAGPRAGNSRANGAANGDTSNNKQSLNEPLDKELYGGNNGDYVSSIAVADDDNDMEDVQLSFTDEAMVAALKLTRFRVRRG